MQCHKTDMRDGRPFSNLGGTRNMLALVGYLWSVNALDLHQSKWQKTIELNINFMIVFKDGIIA